jgi:hypothetical protein
MGRLGGDEARKSLAPFFHLSTLPWAAVVSWPVQRSRDRCRPGRKARKEKNKVFRRSKQKRYQTAGTDKLFCLAHCGKDVVKNVEQ